MGLGSGDHLSSSVVHRDLHAMLISIPGFVAHQLQIIMKRLLFTGLVLVLSNASLSAQVFEEGSKFLHVGVGVGSPYAYSGSKMGVPPLHAAFEIGVTDKIGVGGLVGYTSSSFDQVYFTGNYSWKFSYLIVGARGAFHFLDHDKIDAYGGVLLGYNIASAKFESTDPDLERFCHGAQRWRSRHRCLRWWSLHDLG